MNLALVSGKGSIAYTSIREDPTASETGNCRPLPYRILAPVPGICSQNELVHLETVHLVHLIDILIH